MVLRVCVSVLSPVDTAEAAVTSASLKFKITHPLTLGDLGHNAWDLSWGFGPLRVSQEEVKSEL